MSFTKRLMMLKPAYKTSLFPHWFTVPVRFRDLDPLNHVNNAIFSTYYEQARIQFTQKVPAFASNLEHGFSFVIASLYIDFIKPVTFPADLLIGSGIKEIGNTTITAFQAIYNDESKQLVSVAQSTGVWYDLNADRPTRLPEINEPRTVLVSEELLQGEL